MKGVFGAPKIFFHAGSRPDSRAIVSAKVANTIDVTPRPDARLRKASQLVSLKQGLPFDESIRHKGPVSRRRKVEKGLGVGLEVKAYKRPMALRSTMKTATGAM